MTDAREWRLDLPYSKPPLSLNDRMHYMVKSRLTKSVRSTVNRLARDEHVPQLDRIRVELHYQPRNRGTRDADNLVATLKPAIDGLRDALVVPDDDVAHVTWPSPTIHQPGPPHATGRLWLIIREETPDS